MSRLLSSESRSETMSFFTNEGVFDGEFSEPSDEHEDCERLKSNYFEQQEQPQNTNEEGMELKASVIINRLENMNNSNQMPGGDHFLSPKEIISMYEDTTCSPLASLRKKQGKNMNPFRQKQS